MKLIKKSNFLAAVLVLLVAGCASEVPLGNSIATLKAEQTYNANAWAENMAYVPGGSGERMQSTLEIYHTQTASSKNDGSINAQTVLAIPVN
jgi:hypothetical protein